MNPVPNVDPERQGLKQEPAHERPKHQTRWRLWVFCDYYTVWKVKSNDICLAEHSHFMHGINVVKTSCGQLTAFSFKIWMLKMSAV